MVLPVSVVVPCYLCADTIGRAVISVFTQTTRPAEVLLVDDASPDQGQTLAALHALERSAPADIRVSVSSLTRNSGPAAARNRAWEMSQERYVAFLDADDAWHPRKLEVQCSLMEERGDLAMTGHETFVATGTPHFAPLPTRKKFVPVSKVRLLLGNVFPTRSVMLRRELPFRFEASKRYSEDYHLWLRVLLSGRSAARISLPLACSFKHDFGAGGLSGQLWDMEQGELDTYRRLCRENCLPAWAFPGLAGYSLVKYAVRTVRSTVRRQRWHRK